MTQPAQKGKRPRPGIPVCCYVCGAQDFKWNAMRNGWSTTRGLMFCKNHQKEAIEGHVKP